MILDLAGSSTPIWLGAVRVGTNPSSASFANIDGTPFDYSYWEPGEPNNQLNIEYCVSVSDSYDSGKYYLRTALILDGTTTTAPTR